VCAAAMENVMTMMLAVAVANSVAGGGDGLPTEGDLSLTTVACGGWRRCRPFIGCCCCWCVVVVVVIVAAVARPLSEVALRRKSLI